MDEQDTKEIYINPFYAINIEPSLFAKHEVMVSEEQWVEVNVKLIDELGAKEWLTQLLHILKAGDGK